MRRLHQLYHRSSIPPYDPGGEQENRLVFFDPPEKIRGFLMKFRLWNDKYEEGEYKIGIGLCDICASLLENISTLACDKYVSDNIEPTEYTKRVTGIHIENPEGDNLMVLDGNTLLCRWCGKKDFRKGSTYSMHNHTFQSLECIACGRKSEFSTDDLEDIKINLFDIEIKSNE